MESSGILYVLIRVQIKSRQLFIYHIPSVMYKNFWYTAFVNEFTKLNIKDIPIEEAHGGSGAGQVLVKPEHITSQYLEAVTKGFLKAGKIFDWHIHQDTDEIFIVLKGEGKYYCEDQITKYKEGDVMITPANLKHKIEAGGTIENEYYFIRIKAK